MKTMPTTQDQFTAALTITPAAFYRYVAMGIIVDGRAGGLVVGRRRKDGGIAVIRQKGDEFFLQQERIGGDDFVMHPDMGMPDRTERDHDLRIRPFSHLIVSDARPDDKI